MYRSERARIYTPEERDWVDVALSQPHRRPAIKSNGEVAARGDDPRLGYALGRLCAHYKPMPLGEHLEQAGNDYGQLYRRAVAALGLEGSVPRDGPLGVPLTDEELKDRKEKENRKLKEANQELIAIDYRLKSRMHALCVLDFDPNPDHIEMLKYGLIMLDRHFSAARKGRA
jgi:hypothetical protein